MSTVSVPGRWQRVRYSFESLGWRRTAHELLTHRRPYEPADDLRFDARHGTDTAGSVEPELLGIDDADVRDKAIRYLPSPVSVTDWMLDRVDVDPAASTFVDLGCGKGRVLLVAARRPFLRVVGIEISSELAAIASHNVERYRPPPPLRSEIHVITADVTTLDLPETDLLVHLYHPFEPVILAPVMRRLEASLARAPRRVTIAYLAYTGAVAEVAETLDQFPWLTLVRYEQSIRGHYNWLILTAG
jgi:SAM-dependent methyltransferase